LKGRANLKPTLFRFSAEIEALLQRRPAAGPLFPYLCTVRAGDRATEFKQRCDGLGIAPWKSMEFIQVFDAKAPQCLWMHGEDHSVRMQVKFLEALGRLGLENGNAFFGSMNGDQLEGWQVASGLELGCNLRSCRKRAVGLRPFIDVALHMRERRVATLGAALVSLHAQLIFPLPRHRQIRELVFNTFFHYSILPSAFTSL
jgi:hypothetical protein